MDTRTKRVFARSNPPTAVVNLAGGVEHLHLGDPVTSVMVDGEETYLFVLGSRDFLRVAGERVAREVSAEGG